MSDYYSNFVISEYDCIHSYVLHQSRKNMIIVTLITFHVDLFVKLLLNPKWKICQNCSSTTFTSNEIHLTTNLIYISK